MLSSSLAKLLVLTARPRLNAGQEERAVALCAADIDWRRFMRIAEAKQSLPLAYRNLAALKSGGPPASFKEDMHRKALTMTMAALRMMSAQITFQKTCLDGCGADYAYIKGSAVAAAYYGDVGLRCARDIDVLVRETMIPAVVFQALASGYTMDFNGQRANRCSEADIVRTLRQQSEVTLRSPEGVSVEVHCCLGKDGFAYFDSDHMLRNKVSIVAGGISLNMLHINDLFAYICYHHTGHYWSRLHWLADLDAIMHHPSFNNIDILTSAKQYRMQETVEACIALNQLSSDLEGWDSDNPAGRGKQLLRACLKNLEGGMSEELNMRKGIYIGGFAFKWQRRSATSRQIFIQKMRKQFEVFGFALHFRQKVNFKSLEDLILRISKDTFRAIYRRDGI